jgi:hypothetical protein
MLMDNDLHREEFEIPFRIGVRVTMTTRLKKRLNPPQSEVVNGTTTGGQRHGGVGSFVPCRGHLDGESLLPLRCHPCEELRVIRVATTVVAQSHVSEKHPGND